MVAKSRNGEGQFGNNIIGGQVFAQRKFCPRNATLELKKLYKAKNMGICINAGIQPPNGFTPASR